MHDVILYCWADELGLDQSTAAGRVCCSVAAVGGNCVSWFRDEPPLVYPGCSYDAYDLGALNVQGKARLAGVFDSFTAMQQAVLAQRQAACV